MVQGNNSEQDKINRERLIDINLVLQYMEALDVNKEYFTELGEGHLRGLASVKDEIKFVNSDVYDKLVIECKRLKKKNSELSNQASKQSIELGNLKRSLGEAKALYKTCLKNKKSWF